MSAINAAEGALGSGASAAAPGVFKIALTGLVFAAQSGVEYRRLRKGRITKREFKKRMKRGVYVSSGNLVGGSAGMVVGFVVGQVLIPLPVVGGIIGTVVGGTIGGIAGMKVSVKVYERLEKRLAQRQVEAYEQSLKEAKERE